MNATKIVREQMDLKTGITQMVIRPDDLEGKGSIAWHYFIRSKLETIRRHYPGLVIGKTISDEVLGFGLGEHGGWIIVKNGTPKQIPF